MNDIEEVNLQLVIEMVDGKTHIISHVMYYIKDNLVFRVYDTKGGVFTYTMQYVEDYYFLNNQTSDRTI